MKMQQKTYNFDLPIRYLLSPSSYQDDRLVVLLHGYQDNAQSMLKRLGWPDMELPFRWLAINAPFPVPLWNLDGFKEAYSWYFRDTSKNLVLVEPSATAAKVAGLIKDLQLSELPTVLFGFSQGGYLAPFLAKNLPTVKGIIGLGCGYTEEGYAGLNPLPVHAVHGDADERIDIKKAQLEHASILKKGFSGEFHEVAGHKHRVDKNIEPLIRDLIQQIIPENS